MWQSMGIRRLPRYAPRGMEPADGRGAMRNAEDVTFGGSGLDRAAEVRNEPERLEAMFAAPDAGVIPVWRGKPLFDGRGDTPVWLPPEHRVVADHDTRVFLGLDGHAPRFAVDVSSWTPAEIPDAPNAFFDASVQRHPGLPESHGFAELRAHMARLPVREAELVATARALLGWHAAHRFCANCGAASELAQGGWQRTCPDCAAHHFPRTDPVAIMLVTHGNDLLVGRSPGWPEGMYSLLAGYVEPGETIEAAARREVLEEAGVTVGEVSYLASQPWPFPSSLMVGCHAAATSRELRIDPAEIDDALWISRERMAAIHADREPGMSAARRGSIANFLIGRWLADRLD